MCSQDTTFIGCFSSIKDPRVLGRTRHKLIDIICVAICAIVSGADNWVDIAEFGRQKNEWLNGFLELPNGIPSHDVFTDVFSRISPQQFKESFAKWVQSVFETTGGQIIPIDGKTLRRSHDRSGGKAAIHVVSAWASANKIVLGQIKTEEKSNEITAIPELLRLLEIKGCIVTIDAMGCQTAIAAQIIDQEGDYVLALKGNQANLYDDVKAFFEDPKTGTDDDIRLQELEDTDGGHGRVDVRRIRCTSDISWLDEKGRWKGLSSICAVESERHLADKITKEVRYFIGSIKADPQLWIQATRDHWSIENGLHWRLDVVFREDECRVRKGHGPDNFAVLRHIAMNILSRDKSKGSYATKRYRAALNDGYRQKLLAAK